MWLIWALLPENLSSAFPTKQSKKDSKDQKSIQSSTTPVPDSNKITINITKKSQEVSPFPSGDHKVAMNKTQTSLLR